MTFPVGNLISNPSTALDGQLGAGFGTLPKKPSITSALRGEYLYPTGSTNLAVAPRGTVGAQDYAYNPFPRGTIGRGTNANQTASPEEQANRNFLPALEAGGGTNQFNATQRVMYETGKTLNQVLNGRTNTIYPAYNNSITNPKVQPNPFMTQAMLPKPTPDARAEESRFTGSNQPQQAVLNNIVNRMLAGDETVSQAEQESLIRVLGQEQQGNFNPTNPEQSTDKHGDPVIQEGTKKWVRGSDGIVRRAIARGGKFRVQPNRGSFMRTGGATASPTPSSPTLPSSIGVVNLNLASG